MSGGWSISVKGIRTETLMELYQLLGSDRSRALEIQKELVARAEAQGLTMREILNTLVARVGKKRDRALIAKEWCEALGLTEQEAKRLAD